MRKNLFELSPSLYKGFFLNRILKRSRDQSPYYKTFKNFNSIPVINKKIFLDNFVDLNSFALSYDECLSKGLAQENSRIFKPEPEGYSIGLSSGTSGKRGVFLTTEDEQLKWAANLLSHLSWFSFLSKYRIGFILRANSPMYEKVSRSKRINFKFFDLMIPLDKLLLDFSQYNPTIIVAPSYILEEILKYKTSNPSLFLEVKIIVSVADVLSDELKNRLKEAFICPIHQIYQATEGFLATTCIYENLHLNEDLLLFEKEYVDVNTKRFTPIITDYFRETQSFIRYRLDDILILNPDPCACGSKKDQLLRIEGRSDEVLTFDGIKVFPDYLRNAIQNALNESLDFCINKKDEAIVVKLAGQFNQDIQQKIIQNISQLLSQLKIKDIKCTVEFEFQRDFSQKRRRVYDLDKNKPQKV